MLTKTTVSFLDINQILSYNILYLFDLKWFLKMDRTAVKFLQEWLLENGRKPLVLRGARQVGKTWLVHHFAKLSGKKLIEINFEKQPHYIHYFATNDSKQILLNLSAAFHYDITPEKCLLFLDEIQSAPEILAKLRWFAEDLPELPVIAAGSLLEFLLADHTFSMPVGRIGYLHLEPLSFEEFLVAQDKKILCDYLSKYDFKTEIPLPLHQQFISLFKEYVLVGGLPAAVSSWISERSLSKVNKIQHNLLATYRDDFSKYNGRIAIERLDETMMAVPKMLGQKFVLSHVNPTAQSKSIKQAINLLNKARICHRVSGSHANGVPLSAETKEKYFKEIFVDVGLCSVALDLNLNEINSVSEINLINQGAIAEQVVGQLLRTINPFYIQPALYYWVREEKGSSAEVDYVISHQGKVVPIEVKAGSTGTLKSLHLMMALKKLKTAVRINSDFPTKTNVKMKNHLGQSVEYTLLSIPFYLLSEINRLLS